MRNARTGLVMIAATALGGIAGPAGAGVTEPWVELHFAAADHPSVQCADGTLVGIGFEVRRRWLGFSDSDGAPTRDQLQRRYDGVIERLDTGATLPFGHGTVNTTFDYVRGIVTQSGSYRSVAWPGEGIVMHSVGHEVFDLETDQLLSEAGPKVDEVSNPELLCAAFGLPGGVSLESR